MEFHSLYNEQAQEVQTILRKNNIETYDNLLMKMDTPSYEGTFFDLHK